MSKAEPGSIPGRGNQLGASPWGESHPRSAASFRASPSANPAGTKKERCMKSIMKWLPTAIITAVALFGASGSAVSAPAAKDGKITAKEVRALIVKAGYADRTRGRVTPRIAEISQGDLLLRKGSCAKGGDWERYQAVYQRDGGRLCNGERNWRRTPSFKPHYFGQAMRKIMEHILADAGLESLGAGKVIGIESNGQVATLKFQKFIDGEPTRSGKLLTITGSTVEIENYGPAK